MASHLSVARLARPVPRTLHADRLQCRLRHPGSPNRRAYSSNSGARKPYTSPSLVTFAAVATLAALYATTSRTLHAEAVSLPPEAVIEKTKKKKGTTKEQNRDLISSQHLQVKKSWENPGVYAWGSNTGRVADPDSSEAYIKTPRRIPYFDDLLLRDFKADRNFGAAVTEKGDLIQWGKDFSEETFAPTVTLKGKNLKSVAISTDRIIGISANGSVYSVPVSRLDQETGPKPSERSWIPFWNSSSSISYRTLKPSNLGYSEKVTAISGGLEHVVLLTNTGRVFSASSTTSSFPSRGQLGVPGVAWPSNPEGPHDTCHEITTLRGFEITSIASGDYHSLVLDREGRVFSFGDNSSGQLGFDYSSEAPHIAAPSLIPIQKLYAGASQDPRVTSIAAGGLNSFFTVDAKRIAAPGSDPVDQRLLGRITADTWACGQGIKGLLGTGRWTHLQGPPVKIPALSGLFEYDEARNTTIPIRMARISVGSNHAAAVMANVTYLHASEESSPDTTNWGADVVWWGGNEFYQLGTGKRNNVASPVYIRPLDMQAEAEAGRREEHRFHVTPKHRVVVGGRKVDMEQRVECGRNVTAVYSGV